MMRIWTAFLLVGIALFLQAQDVKEPEKKPAAPEHVAVTATDMTIDGKLDEACWQKAKPAKGDYIHGKKAELSESPRAAVRYAWDQDYLYIGYETFDKNLTAKATGAKQGPKGNQRPGCEIWGPKGDRPDVVEFFFSVDDAQYMWEFHHNANNEFNDVWCVLIPEDRPFRKSIETPWGIRFCHNEYLLDDGDKTVKMAVHLKLKADGKPSTVNQADDTDTGYTAEIRVPWRSLGVPKNWGLWVDEKGEPCSSHYRGEKRWLWRPAGKSIRILAVVQDSDVRKPRYHHSSPTMPGGWFHKSFQHWPEYKLAE